MQCCTVPFQARVARIVWILSVLIGFVGAGYLVGRSISAWMSSPVMTTITTHPIGQLNFPTVTVCPPKGSNTALNYDLMRLKNRTLSTEDRDFLSKEIKKAFVNEGHRRFVDKMLFAANSDNLKQVFSGYHSVPKPYGKDGFKISAWDSNGSLESARFGQEYRKEDYQTNKEIRFVLDHPSGFELGSLLGSKGSLVIDLEVDTRQVEGWQEEVSFLEGPRYLPTR